jgi:3-oxoacyl-[acyl-carrier-protein] synthase-3
MVWYGDKKAIAASRRPRRQPLAERSSERRLASCGELASFSVPKENNDQAYKSLSLFNPEHMKNRLNEVSMDNWIHCIDRAFEKSGLTKDDLNYLAVLHFKRSMHNYMLDLLNLKQEQTTYLSNYGHLGQIDQILSLRLGLEQDKINDGTIISMISAGIGYAWAANVIRWGKVDS